MNLKNLFFVALIGIAAVSPMLYGDYYPIQIITSPYPGSDLPLSEGGTTPGGDGFGAAVSLSNGHLLISGQDTTVQGVNDAGAVCFYKKCGDFFNTYQTPYSEFITGDVPGMYNALNVQGDWAMATVGAPSSTQPGPFEHPGGAVLVFHRHHSKWKLTQVLQPLDVGTSEFDGDFFGDEFGGQFPSFDGDWALIGAPQQEENGVILAGAVYVFHLNHETNQWEQTQKILAPSGPIFNQAFGGACFVRGNYAFISAEGNYTQMGSFPPDNGYAYFYQLGRNGQWQFVELLRSGLPTPPSPNGVGDLFGFRVNFNDEWAAIGAPLDSTNSGGIFLAGAVYLYKAVFNNGQKNWQFVQKLYSDAPALQGAFGTNLLLKGRILYVTDNRSSIDGSLKHVGAVPVYRRSHDTWNQVDTLLNPDPHQLDFFGSALTAEDDLVVVGNNPNFGYYLPYFDFPTFTGPYNNGKVVIFKKN